MNDNKELVREIETVGGFFKDLDERYGLMIRMGLLALAYIIAAVCKYMSAPVEVMFEHSSSQNGVYTGCKVYRDDGQPYLGLTENNEVVESYPIVKGEYDDVMDIDYDMMFFRRNTEANAENFRKTMEYNMYLGGYCKVTLKYRSGKTESTSYCTKELVDNMERLSRKYAVGHEMQLQ